MRTFKLKSLALKTLSFVLVLFMVFTLIGCKDKDDVKMSMSLDKESYVKGSISLLGFTINDSLQLTCGSAFEVAMIFTSLSFLGLPIISTSLPFTFTISDSTLSLSSIDNS